MVWHPETNVTNGTICWNKHDKNFSKMKKNSMTENSAQDGLAYISGVFRRHDSALAGVGDNEPASLG